LLVTVTGSGFKVQGSGLKAKNETVFGCIRLKCYRRFKRNLKWKIGVVGCELWVVGCGLGEIEGGKAMEFGIGNAECGMKRIEKEKVGG
jgi:hypothetical protein